MDMVEKENRIEALSAAVRKAAVNPTQHEGADQIVESAEKYFKFLQGDAAGGESEE